MRQQRMKMKMHPHGVQPEHFATLLGDDNSTRSKGLGDLHILSDEAILLILESLEPFQLGRIATVSKALYCFASHEDLWKSFVLQLDDSTSWLYEKTWKMTYVRTMHAQQSENVTGSCIVVDHFYSDLLHQPWFCATLDIDESWITVDTIERRSNLTLEEFQQSYEDLNRPVIVTDVVPTWEAYENWSRDELMTAFKDTTVVVGDAPMRFDAYVKYCDEQQDENPLYMFDKHFCRKAPKLEKDYSVPLYFREDLFSLLGDSDRPDYRWLIYGPYKSGSTFHKDPNATSAWNAVIFGSKKWIMYPPHVVPPGVRQSDDGADVASPISLMEWMLSFYDIRDCDGVAPVEFVQKRGELLFVPRGWWHMAINLEETCAITQNFVSKVNLPHVLRFLRSPKANILVSGVETDPEKVTLHDRFLTVLRDRVPAIVESLPGFNNTRQKEKRKHMHDKV